VYETKTERTSVKGRREKGKYSKMFKCKGKNMDEKMTY
jgi:hypothetical protein